MGRVLRRKGRKMFGYILNKETASPSQTLFLPSLTMSSCLGQAKFGFRHFFLHGLWWKQDATTPSPKTIFSSASTESPQRFALEPLHPACSPFFRFYVLPLLRKADSPLNVKELGRTLLSESYMHPWVGLTSGALERGRVRGRVQRQVSIMGAPHDRGLWGHGDSSVPRSVVQTFLPSLLQPFKTFDTFFTPAPGQRQCFCEQNRQPAPLSKDKRPLPHCTFGTWWPHLIQAY